MPKVSIKRFIKRGQVQGWRPPQTALSTEARLIVERSSDGRRVRLACRPTEIGALTHRGRLRPRSARVAPTPSGPPRGPLDPLGGLGRTHFRLILCWNRPDFRPFCIGQVDYLTFDRASCIVGPILTMGPLVLGGVDAPSCHVFSCQLSRFYSRSGNFRRTSKNRFRSGS